ncbi:MAG: hypothetical protein Ct9H300mP1_22700 [Planctomycetaceae bacterium]|nr:MAG: hypothetical protein Ct9H300mP1_22700 [Planctomycetaceae bacterium]
MSRGHRDHLAVQVATVTSSRLIYGSSSNDVSRQRIGNVRMISSRNLAHVVCTIVVVLLLPAAVAAQGLEHVKANYTKYEYRIPMRDGKRLFTSVYVPKDDSQTYPILLKRTPYSARPYGADQYPENLGPSPLFAREGYIFVYQDVRGRWMSEGRIRPHAAAPGEEDKEDQIDESTDTWDTVEWLIKRVRGHNGPRGHRRISYPGFYTAAGIIDSHPAIKAASPQAPVNDWFIGDDWHHNGAFFLAPHVQLDVPQRSQASRTDQEISTGDVRLRHPRMATSSIAASRRSRRSTRSISRGMCRSGSRPSVTGPTTSSGSRATSVLISTTSMPR